MREEFACLRHGRELPELTRHHIELLPHQLCSRCGTAPATQLRGSPWKPFCADCGNLLAGRAMFARSKAR